MPDQKNKSNNSDKKIKPSVSNDQLGENAGEGRYEKSAGTKDGKCR
jgi:hypothetical protein